MKIVNLYRYIRPDGGTTNSINVPDIEDYTIRYRLIADNDKELTNGFDKTTCVDTDDYNDWYEIDKI